ncbi:MAG: hypothetical protein Q7R93_05015 [bacterium]|nr:hypothetical protein [bacterium]
MNYPPVAIVDVTSKPEAEKTGKGINLGDPELNEVANRMLLNRRSRARKVFHLKWEGSKIPRGAVIEGAEIAWTQNGEVAGVGGKRIGVYDRLIEFGGATGKEQQMLIFVP